MVVPSQPDTASKVMTKPMSETCVNVLALLASRLSDFPLGSWVQSRQPPKPSTSNWAGIAIYECLLTSIIVASLVDVAPHVSACRRLAPPRSKRSRIFSADGVLGLSCWSPPLRAKMYASSCLLPAAAWCELVLSTQACIYSPPPTGSLAWLFSL